MKCAKSSPTDSVAEVNIQAARDAAGELREARRDVERQQAQGEAALRELDAARAFVVLGMHDRVEPRRRAPWRAPSIARSPGSRLCSFNAAASSRSEPDRSCAASASGVSAASQSSRGVPRRISASAASDFSTAPNSAASALAARARPRELVARVAHQQLDLAAAEARAEELRGEIRDLVRLVEDHRVRRAEQVAEAVFLEREVGEQQMVIDDDDVGLDGLAARFDHVAARRCPAQRAPRQFSRVEVIWGHSGCASPRSGTSARSPVLRDAAPSARRAPACGRACQRGCAAR